MATSSLSQMACPKARGCDCSGAGRPCQHPSPTGQLVHDGGGQVGRRHAAQMYRRSWPCLSGIRYHACSRLSWVLWEVGGRIAGGRAYQGIGRGDGEMRRCLRTLTAMVHGCSRQRQDVGGVVLLAGHTSITTTARQLMTGISREVWRKGRHVRNTCRVLLALGMVLTLTVETLALEASRLTIGLNFTSSTLFDSGFIPPDTMGGVGPDHIVVLINGRY